MTDFLDSIFRELFRNRCCRHRARRRRRTATDKKETCAVHQLPRLPRGDGPGPGPRRLLRRPRLRGLGLRVRRLRAHAERQQQRRRHGDGGRIAFGLRRPRTGAAGGAGARAGEAAGLEGPGAGAEALAEPDARHHAAPEDVPGARVLGVQATRRQRVLQVRTGAWLGQVEGAGGVLLEGRGHGGDGLKGALEGRGRPPLRSMDRACDPAAVSVSRIARHNGISYRP